MNTYKLPNEQDETFKRPSQTRSVLVPFLFLTLDMLSKNNRLDLIVLSIIIRKHNKYHKTD